MVVTNKFDLYLKSQNAAPSGARISEIYGENTIYHKALTELKAGKKEGHWIWFIFPQTPKPGMVLCHGVMRCTAEKMPRSICHTTYWALVSSPVPKPYFLTRTNHLSRYSVRN